MDWSDSTSLVDDSDEATVSRGRQTWLKPIEKLHTQVLLDYPEPGSLWPSFSGPLGRANERVRSTFSFNH